MSKKNQVVNVPPALVAGVLAESAAGDVQVQPVHVSADLIDLVEAMRKAQRLYFNPGTPRLAKGQALQTARKLEKQVDGMITLFRVEQRQYADFVAGQGKDIDPEPPAEQPALMVTDGQPEPAG
jgi:hypothetical protein